MGVDALTPEQEGFLAGWRECGALQLTAPTT